jgi:hypothetical protein
MRKTLTQLFPGTKRGLLRIALLTLLPLAGWGQARPLVISQLYTAGGTTNATYRNDYVELFNPGSTTVLLSGYSLTYTNTSGTATSLALSTTASVAAGGYYLVQYGTSNAALGAALPATADKSGTNLAAGGGRLDLQQGTTLADRVGYGTAAVYEGSAAAPVSSATRAVFRAFGGCTDSNDNAADFAAGTPTPRTPDSATNPCNGPAPTITSFAPPSGPVGASVTIGGMGFTSSAAVAFNGAAALVTFMNATTLMATVPSGATTGAISVTTATGTATSASNFTVTVPVLTASPTTLTGLAATPGAASPAQRYQLSGSSLDGTAVLIRPSTASLEVSLDGFAYGPTASLPLNGSATLAPTSIYVRVASGGAMGSVAGSVVNSNGTTTTTVSVSGAVVAPLAAKRWTGAAGTTSWFDAANWEGSAVPVASDDVVLDHRYVVGSYTVVLGNSPSTVAVTVASLRLRPLSGEAIELSIPTTNTLPAITTDGPALTLTRSLAGDTALSVGSRALVTNASGAPAVTNGPDIIEVAGTNPTAFLLNGGSYRHQTSRSVASLVENLSATAGTEAGNFYYRVPQASYATLAAGRTYGNLIFQRGSTNAGPSSYTSSGSAPLTINGSLIIESNVVFAASLLGNIVLRGNLQNSGNFRFAPNNAGSIARLVLQGTTPQLIAGTALADPSASTDSYLSAAVQLEINNPAGVTLRTPLTLSNTLVLNNGLLTTDATNSLTLTAAATVQGGSDASFVSGPVRRPIGPVSSTTSFLFPIGKGAAYRPLTLTVNTQSSTTVYRAEQMEGNAARTLANPDPSGTNLARVSRARYVTLTPFSPDAVPMVTQPLGFTGNVTVRYGASDGVATPTATSLVIAKRADTTQPWTNAGRQGATGTASAGTVTSGNLTSFSDFALGSTDPSAATNPLPVQLATFTATRQPSGSVALAWTTASEVNSALFELERSADGSTFGLVAAVPAQGYSASPHAYATRDATTLAGPLYYRLRLVDADGTAAYSPVAIVAGSQPSGIFLLAPNPAHNYLNLTTELPTLYTVRSILGQALLSGAVASGPAMVPLDGLPAGVYFMELRTAAGRVVQRFVKE